MAPAPSAILFPTLSAARPFGWQSVIWTTTATSIWPYQRTTEERLSHSLAVAMEPSPIRTLGWFPEKGAPNSVAMADMNKDGNLDLVGVVFHSTYVETVILNN